jgi:hypothetical protein
MWGPKFKLINRTKQKYSTNVTYNTSNTSKEKKEKKKGKKM